MIYAKFDTDGLPISFYRDDVHGPRQIDGKPNPATFVPPEAVEISSEQWQVFIDNQGMRRWQNGVVVEYTPPAPVPLSSDVDAERDRRIALGFAYAGKIYQARERDILNIAGKATRATKAIVDGVMKGDLQWATPGENFAWIAADNSLTAMDAYTMVEFGQAADDFVTFMFMRGRAIKDRLLAGEALDITEDSLWLQVATG